MRYKNHLKNVAMQVADLISKGFDF